MIHYGGCNEGFDLLIPSLCFGKPDTIHFSFIEARYSCPSSKSPTADYKKDIMEKYDKFRKAANYFTSLCDFKKIGKTIEWHYIHVAHRRVLSSSVTGIEKNLMSMPDNMIIIGKEALIEMYGSLAELTMFISDPEEMRNEMKNKAHTIQQLLIE